MIFCHLPLRRDFRLAQRDVCTTSVSVLRLPRCVGAGRAVFGLGLTWTSAAADGDRWGRWRAACSPRFADASPPFSQELLRSLATLRAFAWVSPIDRRCKASLFGLSADMPWRRCGAPDSRRPARAGIPTELPATSRCRPEFCGDDARATRSGASRATAPRRLSGHGVAHKIQLIERFKYDGAAREQ